MIFYASDEEHTWYKPSECLWSAPVQLRGKVNLSTQYHEDLREFFVDSIGVREIDAEMVYNELLIIDTEIVTVQHVKDLLWSLNSQLKIETPDSSPEDLLRHCILPVRYANGQVRLCSSAKEFAIVDHKKLGAIFRDRVETLDFTMTEIRQLEPFIRWSGREVCYLSRLVKEITILDSAIRVPVSDPTQDIRKKARGLHR